MSEQQTRFAKWTAFGGALAAIFGAFAGWAYVQPALEWFGVNLLIILRYDPVHAVLAGVGVGASLGLWLPPLLPARFTSERAKASVRVLSAFVTFGVAVMLNPTRLGVIYGLISAMSGTTLAMLLVRGIVRSDTIPTPESLKESPAEIIAKLETAAGEARE